MPAATPPHAEPRLRFEFGPSIAPILQTESAECGLACLAMVAGWHGYRTDLSTLRRRFSISLKGATLNCRRHDQCRSDSAIPAQTCHNEFAFDLKIACEGNSLCNLIADVYVWAVETFDTDAASEWSDWGDSRADMGGGGGGGEGGGGGGGGGGYAYFEEQVEEAEST